MAIRATEAVAGCVRIRVSMGNIKFLGSLSKE
jgi:hypothetical protein